MIDGSSSTLTFFDSVDAPLVVDDVVGELIDEHVAFDEQGGDAERQIELRRGQSLRRIGPADVLDRHMRAVHHDGRDIVRAERRLRLHHADGVERGVVAADAGIEFQRNAHRLPLPAELRRQFVEIEAVGRAREGRAKAAIGRFEHVDDAGEAGLRQQRAVKPALRRAPGMHALDHGAVLRGHQSRGLRAGDAERVHGLVGGEAQGGGRARRGGKHADGRAGMPALPDMLRAHAFADARADLVAGDRRAQEIAAAHAGVQLGHRQAAAAG